jgi:hypothetical protein
MKLPSNEDLAILFTILAIAAILVLYWAVTGSPMLVD